MSRTTLLATILALPVLPPGGACLAGPAEGRQAVHLSVWSLPAPEDTSIGAKCDRAILRAFKRKFPHVRLSSPTGIVIPEAHVQDTRPLMAIAGGVSPDVIYVNFRQSDTYIQEGFLYPLDEWFEKFPEAVRRERLLPQVKKVVYRWGPGKKTGQDPDKHYWCLPYANYIKALIWRKDLFQAAGLDPNRPPKDWQEYYEFAQRCTDPAEGIYGIFMPTGPHWAWYFYSQIVSAGATIMEDRGEDEWVATFNTPGAVTAYQYVLKLVQGPWRHPGGKVVEGVVYREQDVNSAMWNQGRIAMKETYLRDDLLADINPELVGIAPVPAGPSGERASELNTGMCGVFTGAARKGPDVLQAAWEYVNFLGSTEARLIRTRILVENGYGLFANPEYLKQLGYTDYLRRIPKSWRDAFTQALREGEPEPYGRNTQNVYKYMTHPIDEMLVRNLGRREFDAVEAARRRIRKARPGIGQDELDRQLAAVREKAHGEVRSEVKAVLDDWVHRANVKMIGRVPPEQMRVRRLVALVVAITIALAFAALFAYTIKAFTPRGAKGGWQFRRYALAYVILVPALATIALWQYVPMVRGALMAFQDYRIILPSRWVGLDNFANVLWDAEFWKALRTSLWYAFLSIMLGFFAPIALAILLHEVPKGKILFRTIYYLPAVISGLVVMLMWKNFYEPSDRGLLNQITAQLTPGRVLAFGLIVAAGLGLSGYFNLRARRKGAGLVLGALALVILGATVAVRAWGTLPPHSQKWLHDPHWAMLCVILPTVWAGIGPGCLIYLAALKTIPEDLYEAADLDGAGFLGKARHVTLPTIKVLILITFIGAVVNAFRIAGYILAMTGGGPAGATQVLALKVFFDAFVYLRFGIATATAWILGAMLIGFTVFQLRRLSRVEFRTAGA